MRLDKTYNKAHTGKLLRDSFRIQICLKLEDASSSLHFNFAFVRYKETRRG
jgi:hypothetical protein